MDKTSKNLFNRNNKEIYSYMHDIFGKNVMNLFDVADSENLIEKVANEDKNKADESSVKEISTNEKSDERKKKEDFKADTKKA